MTVDIIFPVKLTGKKSCCFNGATGLFFTVYPLDWMDDMESGIFGFLMKNWNDSAKKNQRISKVRSKRPNG